MSGFGPNDAFKTTLKPERVLAGAWFQKEVIIIFIFFPLGTAIQMAESGTVSRTKFPNCQNNATESDLLLFLSFFRCCDFFFFSLLFKSLT